MKIEEPEQPKVGDVRKTFVRGQLWKVELWDGIRWRSPLETAIAPLPKAAANRARFRAPARRGKKRPIG
jgi:hypothetical protein